MSGEQSFEDFVRDRIHGTNGAWVEVRAELKRRDLEKSKPKAKAESKAEPKAEPTRTRRLPKAPK